MPAIEPFYYLLDRPKKYMSKNEILLAEIIFFLQLEYALNKIIKVCVAHERHDHDDKENAMMENHFVRNLLEDILSTEEYTLSGIAYHLKIPEEILSDILIGYNQTPSLSLARKIMELHKCVRRELYQFLVRKMMAETTYREITPNGVE